MTRTVTARISRMDWKKDLAWSEKNAGRGDARRVALWHPKSENVELFRSVGPFESDGIELPYPAYLQPVIVAPVGDDGEDVRIALTWV
ncbi:MAG: hypothetical protein PWP08_1276 [Methanofollis sp.]|nr:hypothetical protein [Methanofollis sp.]